MIVDNPFQVQTTLSAQDINDLFEATNQFSRMKLRELLFAEPSFTVPPSPPPVGLAMTPEMQEHLSILAFNGGEPYEPYDRIGRNALYPSRCKR